VAFNSISKVQQTQLIHDDRVSVTKSNEDSQKPGLQRLLNDDWIGPSVMVPGDVGVGAPTMGFDFRRGLAPKVQDIHDMTHKNIE